MAGQSHAVPGCGGAVSHPFSGLPTIPSLGRWPLPAHDLPLITTIVAGLGIAFVLAAIAQRLRISPLVGYLLAGVIVGPATPGYVADRELAPELAELGVILLMFGV